MERQNPGKLNNRQENNSASNLNNPNSNSGNNNMSNNSSNIQQNIFFQSQFETPQMAYQRLMMNYLNLQNFYLGQLTSNASSLFPTPPLTFGSPDLQNRDVSSLNNVNSSALQGSSNSNNNPNMENDLNVSRGNLKKYKKNTHCPHKDRKHYAKNMCSNCYHSKGRAKRAWKCRHRNKFHYAHGLCQNCYQINYCHKRKLNEENNIDEPDEVLADEHLEQEDSVGKKDEESKSKNNCVSPG